MSKGVKLPRRITLKGEPDGSFSSPGGVIEVEIDGFMVRVGRGAEAKTIAVRAARAEELMIGPSGTAGDGGDQAGRLPQGSGRSRGDRARGDAGRSVLGAVSVFRSKRADRVKLIFWDGTGVCLFAKRLEDGRFQWPTIRVWGAAPHGGPARSADRGARLAAPSHSTNGSCANRIFVALRWRIWLTLVMSTMTSPLPDDHGTLKAMLIAERARAERLEEVIKAMQRHRFGRRAETLSEDQLLLGLEDVEQSAAAAEASGESKTPIRRAAASANRRANRGALPPHLSRIEILHDLDDKS